MKKNKQLYAIIGVAAVVVIVGVVHFGFGRGQQASIGAITNPKCTSAMTPRIVVTSPNGGEVYQDGQSITIKWTSCNLPTGNQTGAALKLYDVNNNYLGNIGLTPNTVSSSIGYANVVLPTLAYIKTHPAYQHATFGLHFRVVVSSYDSITGVKDDSSDNLFTINPVATNVYPPGCSSSIGYSTTSGQSCGCNGTTYSTFNGELCPALKANVVMGTPSYINQNDTSGNVVRVFYTIPISVTAPAQTIYIGQRAESAATPSAGNALSFGFNDATSPTVLTNYTTPAPGVSVSESLSSSDASVEGNGYRLDAGTTKHFTLAVVLSASNITTATHALRVQLLKFQTYTNAALTSGQLIQSLSPITSYQTNYKFISTH